VKEFTEKMLGSNLVTAQTGPEGQLCQKVLINEGITIHKEMYFAIVMDREHGGPCMIGSKYGGMDIEEVAHKTPDEIHVEPISIVKGIRAEQTENMAKKLGLTGPLVKEASEQMQNLYKLMLGSDATQVEINPFAVGSVPGGEQNRIFCVDAKLNFDDNAQFRQKSIFDLRDASMEDARDVAAADVGLNFIGLDGNIGCLVNGAGLAMATMDIIKLKGGAPANFLDVGGGATAKQVTEALKIITSDKQVKAILVNIFGGIMKCDTIAQGIIEGAKNVNLSIPLVVRLEGTNVEKGKELLRNSDIKIITADNLDDAAQKAVKSIHA
jgi:succinyl-CoA synthetase beta subunit